MKREYVSVMGGTCQFARGCDNRDTDYCEVCVFNTDGTTRNFYDGEDLTDEEMDMFEN